MRMGLSADRDYLQCIKERARTSSVAEREPPPEEWRNTRVFPRGRSRILGVPSPCYIHTRYTRDTHYVLVWVSRETACRTVDDRSFRALVDLLLFSSSPIPLATETTMSTHMRDDTSLVADFPQPNPRHDPRAVFCKNEQTNEPRVLSDLLRREFLFFFFPCLLSFLCLFPSASASSHSAFVDVIVRATILEEGPPPGRSRHATPTRGWRRRTRCRQMRPPRRPTAASAVTAPAASPTSTRPSAPMSSWLGNRCRSHKPWRDLLRARRSGRPGRRRTARDYLRATKRYFVRVYVSKGLVVRHNTDERGGRR